MVMWKFRSLAVVWDCTHGRAVSNPRRFEIAGEWEHNQAVGNTSVYECAIYIGVLKGIVEQ